MLRILILSTFLTFTARSQNHPLNAMVTRLLAQEQLVNAMVNLPWRLETPTEITALHPVTPGQTIRIAAAEQPARDHSRWSHWENEDGTVWVDLIAFTDPRAASETLRAARQPYSGARSANKLLLFSNLGTRRREAAGAALIGSNGWLLNVGVKVPAANWDRPMPDADVVAFDAALTRFQATLETAARALLDPAYVSLTPKIEPKPGTLPILRMAAFARLWSYVKYNFVYLDRRPEAHWDTVLEQYLPRIAAAKDDVEYGRILQRVVGLLQDGHTNVYPDAVEPQDQPSVALEPIEGKPVATIVGNLPELSALKPGMELLEIDGTPVATIIERDLDPYISSSTLQDRQLRRMRQLLLGPPGSQMHTKWQTPDGKPLDITLARNGSQHRDALKYPTYPPYDRKDLPGGITYIGLNNFSDQSVAADFEKEFDQLRQAKAWIIDLRYNGGGSGDIGYRILSHFIEKPLEGSIWQTHQYNPSFEAWGRPQTWYVGDPDKIAPAPGPHYQGPIYVLTSPSTCSAAEDFLIPLKPARRITIIGEPTCGSTGQPLPISLYGATARICTKWDRYPDGTEFVGVGVLPDVKAARSKADVASGRDAVLQTAIDLASR